VQEEIGVSPRTFEEIAVLAEPRQAEHGEARYHIFLVTGWATRSLAYRVPNTPNYAG
jgi:hypothetical protein